jgi:DNA-binding NtrC family response regulator
MRILIVDDEPRYAAILHRVLRASGDEVATAGSLAEAVVALADPPHVVLTDLRLGDGTGLEVLSEAKRRAPATAVILMTAFAEVATAREALTKGALDYLTKPFDNAELLALMDRVRPTVATGPAPAIPGMVGASPAMRAVADRLRRFAGSTSTVLITGESGTGKEVAARAVHRLSPRAKEPCVEVNCGALPSGTVESELFGHEKGAFTGADQRREGLIEGADGGTLFLDEVGELPLELQPKLLRFLQERRFNRVGGTQAVLVDVRVVAATNRDLPAEVAAGRFRSDLYHRLAVATVTLPPLRDRREDVPALVDYFLAKHGVCMEPAAMDALREHAWPGNVRELSNVLERAALLADDGVITAADLELQPAAGGSDEPNLDHAERERTLIQEALVRAGGNKSRAAALLGMTRRRLYSRMELLGL